MTWACNSRVNLAKPDLLKGHERSGMLAHQLRRRERFARNFGRRRIKKLNLNQVHEGIRNTRSAGIAAKGFFIVGHPGENAGNIGSNVPTDARSPILRYWRHFA